MGFKFFEFKSYKGQKSKIFYVWHLYFDKSNECNPQNYII